MPDERKKPLYEQIFEHYRDKIVNRELMPGDQLPTEMEMAEIFGVSRITTKRALEELEREGLIYRKRGQGSFVLDLFQKKPNQPGAKNVISIIIPSTSMRGGIWIMFKVQPMQSIKRVITLPSI